jgi:signal transduction histidine kinase
VASKIQALIFKNFSVHRSLILGFLAFGISATLILFFFYISTHQLIVSTELLNQKSRANVLVQKIQNYTAISSQLSRTLKSHISASHMSQTEMESYLKEILSSGPSNLIYGVGVWYEPYRYRSDMQLFGPYAHRDIEQREKLILTYEWNTQEYYYPKQEWYQKSLSHTAQGIYVEPYFDKDLVYVTYATSFFDQQNRLRGVISVDMILPQLQSLIDEVNTNGQEVIYIESRLGFLLGHPKSKEFLELQDKADHKQLIEYKISDLKKTLYIKNEKDQFLRYEETVPDLGWKIVVDSDKNFILKDSYNMLKIILFGLSLFWICIFCIIFFVIRSRNNKNENDLKIKNHQRQLLSSNRLATLGEFSTGLAHEINNPLAIVVGKTDILLGLIQSGNYDPQQFQNELNKIHSNSLRISKIIRGLKAFSRDGELDPLELVSLNQILNDATAITADQLKSKNITFRIIPFLDLQIHCRPNQITQVMLNLISNAIDAIESQVSPWIQIEVRVGAEVDIFVTDSGTGIAPETVKKMMDPFFTTKSIHKGTGLGLSISYGIVKDHNGLLYYNPNCSNTQFVIRLPISH